MDRSASTSETSSVGIRVQPADRPGIVSSEIAAALGLHGHHISLNALDSAIMKDPLSVVAKVASTPDQAMIYVAMLQAEGIPAFTDGGSLTDEFAMSQRLMNVSSVKVMVPASSLEKAQEILKPTVIDKHDLAAQAVGATGAVETPPTAKQPASNKKSGSTAPWIALIATIIALGFMFAWIEARNRYADDPLYKYTNTEQGMSVLLRRDGSQFGFYIDSEHDGIYESFQFWGPDKAWHETTNSVDRDGRALRAIYREKDGLTQTWSRDGANTLFTTCTITDATGKVLQTLEWQPGSGFTLK